MIKKIDFFTAVSIIGKGNIVNDRRPNICTHVTNTGMDNNIFFLVCYFLIVIVY